MTQVETRCPAPLQLVSDETPDADPDRPAVCLEEPDNRRPSWWRNRPRCQLPLWYNDTVTGLAADTGSVRLLATFCLL
jgi:hypothetical protein